MNELKIPYTPKKLVFIGAIMFFGICSGAMGYVAFTNEQELILSKIFEFSVQGATIFYWVISSVSFIFVVIGFLALVKSFISKREIVLSNEYITSPKSGLSNKYVTVKYKNILSIAIQKVQKTKTIIIEHKDGKLSIPNIMLPNKQAYESILNQLQRRING